MMNTLIQTTKIYDEFIDFIVKETNSESLIQFQFSESSQEEIEDLVYRAKNEVLTQEEKKQLDELLFVEHLIRLMKAKAHQYIKNQSPKLS